MNYKIFGAICLGSVEQELCIYEVRSGGTIRTLEKAATVLPLSTDTFGGGRISLESLDALCAMLKKYREVMDSYKVDAYKAYATVAIREAENCDIVLDRIKVVTGLDIELISNSEQRYLNYKALAHNEGEFYESIKSGTLILDTGYGSLQFSIFDNNALISTENIGLGASKIISDLSRARISELDMGSGAASRTYMTAPYSRSMRAASALITAMSPSALGSTAKLASERIYLHSCHSSKLRSMSVPIIMQSSASGYSRRSSATVSEVKLLPSRRSSSPLSSASGKSRKAMRVSSMRSAASGLPTGRGLCGGVAAGMTSSLSGLRLS